MNVRVVGTHRFMPPKVLPNTESSSFLLGCDDDDDDDGSWPPSPSGVSGTTPGLPPVASSDSNRARSARSWSIVPPRARPCCAERRAGRVGMKFKYPAEIVRPAPKSGRLSRKHRENSRPTERGRIPRHNSARDVLAVRVTSRRGDESVGTGVFAFASRDPSRDPSRQ